jgi:oxygen-independent coproporphyrinogen-3 oxidase
VNKCPYCDFFSTTDLSLKGPFLDALFKEAALVQAGDVSFDTVYLGGGTPSLYTPSEIGRLIDFIHRRFSIQPDPEITLEVNPGTANVDRHRLEAYRKVGVNRINIGVQSFQQDQLEFLGRIHSNEEAVETIHAARQTGFINMGIDLIYGLPGQTESSLILDLRKAVSFDPEHLSCYLLTYEPDTRLTRHMNAGQFSPLSDQQTGNLLETTAAYLDAKGYLQYEISNFAKSSEFISRHNSKYWDFTPYLGLGPSAHSYFPPERRWNHSSLPPYLADIENGKPPVAGRETLTRQQQIMEAIYLGLRKTEGINTEKFERFFSADFLNMFKDALGTLTDDALIVLESKHCRLSRKGLRFMDSVAKTLVNTGTF